MTSSGGSVLVFPLVAKAQPQPPPVLVEDES